DDGTGPNDVDMLQFEAAAGQVLMVRPSSDYFTMRRVFGWFGNQLAVSYYGLLTYTLGGPGTYYVGFSSQYNAYYDPNLAASRSSGYYTGDYSLEMSLAFPGSDAIGDTLSDALAAGLGPDVGSVSVAGTIGDNNTGPNDVDMVQFEAEAGQALRVAGTDYSTIR